MTKQGLPILLILMMLITPIASAFEYCSAMDMSAHLSESQSLTVNLSTAKSSLKHKKMLDGKQNNPADMDCQTSNSCTLHGCGGYGLTSSTATVNTVICSFFSSYKYPSPYSTALSPDLRPPIIIL